MKAASAALATELAGPTSTLATCWRLKRTDNTEYGFTDHDQDLTVDSLVYKADTGYTPSALNSSDQLNVDNLETEGFLDSSTLTEVALDGGLFDYAEVEVFVVDWSNLASGKLVLRTGRVGEIKRGDGQFHAEVRGLAQHLQQNIGERTTPTCLARLGDARCKVNLATFTVTGTVETVTDKRAFTDTTRTEADGHFNYGLLTWTSGVNIGLQMEVKRSTAAGVIELFQKMPSPLQVGDAYSVYAGCDKLFATCGTKFSNVVNFRGFPHVPGQDQLLRFGGQS